MEKNKNRTDLIAAGRKKLQQYRKKNKGRKGGGNAGSETVDPRAGEADEHLTDHQEGDYPGVEQSNGDGMPDVVTEADGVAEVTVSEQRNGDSSEVGRTVVDETVEVQAEVSASGNEECREEVDGSGAEVPMVVVRDGGDSDAAYVGMSTDGMANVYTEVAVSGLSNGDSSEADRTVVDGIVEDHMEVSVSGNEECLKDEDSSGAEVPVSVLREEGVSATNVATSADGTEEVHTGVSASGNEECRKEAYSLGAEVPVGVVREAGVSDAADVATSTDGMDAVHAEVSVSEQCNRDSLGAGVLKEVVTDGMTEVCKEGGTLASTPIIPGNGMGESGECSVYFTPISSRTVEGGSAIQSFELVSDPMFDVLSSQAEVIPMEETGAPITQTGLEVECSPVENEDKRDVLSENSEVIDSSLASQLENAQQVNVLPTPVEEFQEEDVVDSGLHKEEASLDGHVEIRASTQEFFGDYGSHILDAKVGVGTDAEDTKRPSVGEDVLVASDLAGKLSGRPLSPDETNVKEEDPQDPVESSSYGRVESLRNLLYLTSIEKDFLQLQLSEQIELNAESCQHSSAQVAKLLDEMKRAHENKDTISQELIQCRSELQAGALENEKLENQCSLMEVDINHFRTSASESQTKLEHSQEEYCRVKAELDNCSCLMEDLQNEKLDLSARLNSETDARKKLVEENCRLASELLEQKDTMLITLNKQMELEGNLREIGASFEELAMENLYLSSNVVVYESKIRELDGFHFELPIKALEEFPVLSDFRLEGVATDIASDGSEIAHLDRGIDVASRNMENSSTLQKEEGIVCDTSDALRVLKGHLEEVQNSLDYLEKLIQDMHYHSVSLSRSSGRAAKPGVSKLIQAFELKTHHVDDSPEVVPVTDGGSSDDPYIPVSRGVCSLKGSLKQMEFDIQMVEGKLKGKDNTRKLSEQFEMEYGAQKQQNEMLQATITDVVQKLSNYKSRTDDLHNCFNEIQQSANCQSEAFLSQIELLQQEANNNTSIVKQESVSITRVIMRAVEQLNATTGLLPSENTDIHSILLASVGAVTAQINKLHEELEAARLNCSILNASVEELNRLCTDIQERKDFTVGVLSKIYRSLLELVTLENTGKDEPSLNFEEPLPENYEKLIENLQVLMDERLQLLSTNSKLELELSGRNHEAEELSIKCKTLGNKLKDLSDANDNMESVLSNKTHNIEEVNRICLALTQKLEKYSCSETLATIPGWIEDTSVAKCDNAENGFSNSLLLRLEALVVCQIQKYEGAIEQINLSKNFLQEVFELSEISANSWSSPLLTFIQREIAPQVIELQEKLQLSSASNLQLENELYILREGLSKIDEAYKDVQSELNSKAFELDQSEQRLASVREKLSMAVAKGKGLIVQRDSLKQSLREKSSELEKCTQELMSKEAQVTEVEAKLKSCSEVERVESLESELSYIRNSATALRDSFLLKDSVLQKIEEVLEDLDLPEHFHSKDIVEKIELLARSVAGNASLSMTDWDQKSSVGISHSDAGFAGVDTWKAELPPGSNLESDEFKRKYEELQNKLRGFAEHNDMLEQSLQERNNLLQKWEEVLNGIDIPSQLRSLDPEDRIEWLKRAFAEVQQERDSLQLKIENLEVSSDMLIVDLEESHKKISELSAEVVAVKSEKDFFSESLGKLRYEYLGLSEKAVHDEIDNDNLRRELDDLQEKLDKNSESKDHDAEKEMWRLHDSIISSLPDSDRFKSLSGGTGTECLERLLKNLIDNYTALQTEKSMQKDSEKELVSEERGLLLSKTEHDAILEDKNQELATLNLELEEASRYMVLLKEERNKAAENYHSLMSEVETISTQMKLLQEERTKDAEKYQTLEFELVAMNQQRDALQEELAQQQEKSVSGENLLLEVDDIRNQLNLLQEEKKRDSEKYEKLVLEFEAIMKHRDALQDQLDQETQKTASAREKLNVAVRKGKGLVQQRDSLKQTIEQMNTALENLKTEHNKRVDALETEKSLLINQLTETERGFHVNNQSLSRLLTALEYIDMGSEVNSTDPVQKIEVIGMHFNELRSAVVSSEHEAKKSKGAVELLVAELSEVQERSDILQEDLTKAIIAKTDAISRLEQFMFSHSEDKKKQIDTMVRLESGIYELRKSCFGFCSLLSDDFAKNMDIFGTLEAFIESILKQINGANNAELPILSSNGLLPNYPDREGRFLSFEADTVSNMHKQCDESLISEHLALASNSLHECITQFNDAKENIHAHFLHIGQKATYLLSGMQTVQRKLASQSEYSESLKMDMAGFELVMKEKENEIGKLRKNVHLLYEACSSSVAEIENRKALVVGNSLPLQVNDSGKLGILWKSPSDNYGQNHTDGHSLPLDDDCIKMADTLVSTLRGSSNNSEMSEANQRQLKATIADLQRELQEKDIQMNRISTDLVSQIREAENDTKKYIMELDSARAQVLTLEKQIEMLANERALLESRVNELKDWEASSSKLQEIINSLSDTVSAKDQEIEALMQALDEEESQMEGLEDRNKQLENVVQEKTLKLERLESSRSKAVSKLSTTVSKFDELHNLSESLLAEIENLQSQLQGRETEISLLRQEVTRCTSDILSLQETSSTHSYDVHQLLKWMDMMVSRCGAPPMNLSDQQGHQIREYTEILEKKIASIMTELDNVRMKAESKEALLQIERGRVEELLCKTEALESSLREKETLVKLSERTDSGQQASSNSPGSLEIEQMRDKVILGPIKTHVRGSRKVNNDYIAIAVDPEKDDNVLEDEDDDKAHGFKSLTMSRIVPRASRPISDRIDGIWVSGERLLMRQPTLRLGLMLYWIALHILLASAI